MMQRRNFIKSGLATAPWIAMAATGLQSKTAMAVWPSAAFHLEDLSEAERLLFADTPVEDSDRIAVTAPDIAENGRVVPVQVVIDLPDPKTLTLLSDGNPFPLLARARLTPDVEPTLSIRVKLGQSANLIALVEADGRLYRATRAVKVTSGGCGG
jgi:sulfur-oxidizing protein SoxY